MLNCLLDYNIKNTLVVISRWVGTHLENRRFEIYYNLTAAACGQDATKNLPWPNKHPKLHPPIPPKQQSFTPYNWNSQSTKHGPWNSRQYSQHSPWSSQQYSQASGPWDFRYKPYFQHSGQRTYKQYGGQNEHFPHYGGFLDTPRFMYTDGRRSSVQV